MPTGRRSILIALFALAAFALGFEIILYAPRVLDVWKPYDYWLYTEMGRAVLEGRNPVGPQHYYPLPTILWIFVPLALLPDWFRLVWVLGPFVSILALYRTRGISLALYAPVWFVVSDAMIDGWLLIPFAWLLENRPILAGLGAVAMLTKPQIALFAVAFMAARWLWTHDWKNLAAFAIGLTVFCLPAFILDPFWIPHLLQVLPMRAGESMSLLPLLTSSVWAWWWLGGWARIVFVAILLAAAVFVGRAAGRDAVTFQSVNLLLLPILFVSNSITLAPALRDRSRRLVLIAISLAAFALDRVAGGFGGGYAFLPLVMLYFQMQAPVESRA